ICLIALAALICSQAVLAKPLDEPAPAESQLVVEEQPTAGATAAPLDASSVPEQCHQPKETGRCFALFYRFAYNLDTHACEEFVYGGCAGNSNNFESKEQCEQLCLGKAAPVAATASSTEQSTELTTEQIVVE
ncbi:CG3604, partial [Drosophila busckii]